MRVSADSLTAYLRPMKRRRDLPLREIRSRLQAFGPTDAAFVLHLVQCERCRGYAARLFALDEETSRIRDLLTSLTPIERDLVLHLTRGGFWLVLTADTPEDDLSPLHLWKFLDSLAPEAAAFLGHLLGCERCREAAAKILSPSR
jgi:hypothetical protein